MTATNARDYFEANCPRAEMHLTTSTNATLTSAGTYYQLTQNLTDGSTQKFTLNTGTLTYTESGKTGKVFNFAGHASVSADKACELTFALFIDDVEVPGCITPATIQNPNIKQHINCVQLITLNSNQTVKIKAKSDQASTVLTVSSFSIVLMGI